MDTATAIFILAAIDFAAFVGLIWLLVRARRARKEITFLRKSLDLANQTNTGLSNRITYLTPDAALGRKVKQQRLASLVKANEANRAKRAANGAK